MSLNLSSLLGGGLILKRQIITANGTWTRPAKMAGDTVWLTMIGGGESAGLTSGAGGGWGGRHVIQLPVDIGAEELVPCTIGQGGVQTSGARNPGGATSFGSLVTVSGGSRATGVGTPGASVQASGQTPTPLQNGLDTKLGFGGRVISFTSSNLIGGGGGGLVLDQEDIFGGNGGSRMQGAQGYGAGGNADSPVGYAGAPGAILVEWPEFI